MIDNIINFPVFDESKSNKENILKGIELLELSQNSVDPKVIKLREETAEEIVKAIRAL